MKLPLVLAALLLPFAAMVSPGFASPALAADRPAVWAGLQAPFGVGNQLIGTPAPAAPGAGVSQDAPVLTGGPGMVQVRFDRIEVQGSGLNWLLGAAPDLVTLTARLNGVRMAVVTGMAGFDDSEEAAGQRHKFDVTQDLSRNRATGALMIFNLSIDFSGKNALSLTASLTKINLPPGADSTAMFGLAELGTLALDVTSQGLFETHVLPLVATAMFKGETLPEVRPEADALRAVLRNGLIGLPDISFAPETKAALAQLLAALPLPTGRQTLSPRADPPVGLARLDPYRTAAVPMTPAASGPLLQSVRLDARWTPEFAE